MKETLRITGVLTITCVVCSFFLSFVYSSVKGKIELNQKQRFNDAITILAPDAATVEELTLEDDTVYALFDKQRSLIGYAFLARGQGYQDKITLLAITGPSLQKLKGVVVLESSETPGLGAKIQEPAFLQQFVNKNVSQPLKCIKTKPKAPQDIAAITGATISSRAVVNILNKRLSQLRREIAHTKK